MSTILVHLTPEKTFYLYLLEKGGTYICPGLTLKPEACTITDGHWIGLNIFGLDADPKKGLITAKFFRMRPLTSLY